MADTNNNNQIQPDVDGYEIISTALMELLNSCPLLDQGETIRFSMLDGDEGIGMFPLSGAVIESEVKDILGRTTQSCQYTFLLNYRVGSLNDSRKLTVKEWLDDIGRWLEKQTVKKDGMEYVLEEYPELTGTRKFTSIKRTTPSYLNELNANNTEDWIISISAKYINRF